NAESLRFLELRLEHRNRRSIIVREDGILSYRIHEIGITFGRLRAIEQSLRPRSVTSELKAYCMQEKDSGILRAQIMSMFEKLLRRRRIAHRDLSQSRIDQHENVLRIELDRLPKPTPARFPWTLSAGDGGQGIRSREVIWILAPHRFEKGLGALIIALHPIVIEAIRQLCLDQIRPQFHRCLEGMVRRFPTLRRFVRKAKNKTVL